MSMDAASPPPKVRTARSVGLKGCRSCGRAMPVAATRCTRCGVRMPAGARLGLDAVWAWLIAGIILYIPANLYPMLLTGRFGQTNGSTIIGGVFELIGYGSYAIAAIIFFASVVIPIGKFWVIAHLAVMVRRRANNPNRDPHNALLLYEIVEFIGRWSMIDVFVVAVLAALIQMGYLSTVTAGPAAAFFAVSVAATMLAARAFDPRLIWDGAETGQNRDSQGMQRGTS